MSVLKALFLVFTTTLVYSGCFWEESQKKFIKNVESPPMFWDELTPAQRDYWEKLNNNTKKRVTGLTSKPEQREAFDSLWRRHTKNLKK